MYLRFPDVFAHDAGKLELCNFATTLQVKWHCMKETANKPNSISISIIPVLSLDPPVYFFGNFPNYALKLSFTFKCLFS